MIKRALIRFIKFIKVTEDGCWLWQGHDSGTQRGGGYGRFSFLGKTVAAHIWFWEYINGPREPDMHLDHLCEHRSCVNPDHIEQVTPSVNQQRKWDRIKANYAAGTYSSIFKD